MHPYLRIARPDNWFKNLFVLPGWYIACVFNKMDFTATIVPLLVGLAATNLIASANYVINEWLDRDFDKFHPVKKHRPSVTMGLDSRKIYLEYVLLCICGLGLASTLGIYFLSVSICLLAMGFLYNVKPFRTKDKPYLDVLSESVNNPIRLLLGWFVVSGSLFPPSSLLLTYWMGGAFLMGIKRYSEYRFIGNPANAGQYRKSFCTYTESTLLVSSFLYAICAAFFGGVFLVKHKVELVLAFPLFSILFAWYFFIGLKPESAAQYPERLYKERSFLAYVTFVVLCTLILIKVDIPRLNQFLFNSYRLTNIERPTLLFEKRNF
jgi:4-hydroxybenzoate polyprenyltransferase